VVVVLIVACAIWRGRRLGRIAGALLGLPAAA